MIEITITDPVAATNEKLVDSTTSEETLNQILASFSQELSVQVLASGTASRWTLPEIEQGDSPLAKIDFEPRADIAHSLTFNSQTLEVSFSGNVKFNESNKNGIYSFIMIKLIDTEGFTSTHIQKIQV